jgi:hypothetical protein
MKESRSAHADETEHLNPAQLEWMAFLQNEQPSGDLPPVKDAMRNDEQTPVGIKAPPTAQPPAQFGDAHLDMKDGNATLVVSTSKNINKQR